jgi:(2Fe-2S) ferredoxin
MRVEPSTGGYTRPTRGAGVMRDTGVAGRNTVPKPERQVLVCVNSRPPGNPKGSCGEKGSQELFDRLKEILRERGLEGRVMANRTYCLKHCSRGPVLAVQPDNIWYAGVGASDLAEICTSHLEGGEPVERLLMPDIPWE